MLGHNDLRNCTFTMPEAYATDAAVHMWSPVTNIVRMCALQSKACRTCFSLLSANFLGIDKSTHASCNSGLECNDSQHCCNEYDLSPLVSVTTIHEGNKCSCENDSHLAHTQSAVWARSIYSHRGFEECTHVKRKYHKQTYRHEEVVRLVNCPMP